MLFIIRALSSGVFQAAYVYTPEVYPTVLRSVGVGTCSAMARLGAMLTPNIAQVLMKSSVASAVGVYVAVALLSAVACLLLPVETRGKELGDKHGLQTSKKNKDVVPGAKNCRKISSYQNSLFYTLNQSKKVSMEPTYCSRNN